MASSGPKRALRICMRQHKIPESRSDCLSIGWKWQKKFPYSSENWHQRINLLKIKKCTPDTRTSTAANKFDPGLMPSCTELCRNTTLSNNSLETKALRLFKNSGKPLWLLKRTLIILLHPKILFCCWASTSQYRLQMLFQQQMRIYVFQLTCDSTKLVMLVNKLHVKWSKLVFKPKFPSYLGTSYSLKEVDKSINNEV